MRKILIVDDSEVEQVIIKAIIEQSTKFEADSVFDGQGFQEYLENVDLNNLEAVLLDLNLPDTNGIELLFDLKSKGIDLPVIIISGSRDTQKALHSLELGAIDFITKPPKQQQIISALKNAERVRNFQRQNSKKLKFDLDRIDLDTLIGRDGDLEAIITALDSQINAHETLLITGEKNTGKETLARAFFFQTQKKYEHLVMHDYKFHKSIKDKVKQAKPNTFFLVKYRKLNIDEQEHEILQSILSDIQYKEKNIRFALCFMNLSTQDQAGIISSLKGIHIHCPPLRERRNDLINFAYYFNAQMARKENVPLKTFSDAALKILKDYDWPGNLDEMQIVITQAFIMSKGHSIDRQHLKKIDIHTNHKKLNVDLSISLLNDDNQIKSLKSLEKEIVKKALNHHKNNVSKAAKSLGITRATFYTKLKE